MGYLREGTSVGNVGKAASMTESLSMLSLNQDIH